MFKWYRKHPNGYEVSTQGDIRFSAMFAKMPDGRSIECHYQCDVKGYDVGGTNWRLGKGKPGLNLHLNLWEEYLKLWKIWGKENPHLLNELYENVSRCNFILTDKFANTDVNQARALATILNEKYFNIEE